MRIGSQGVGISLLVADIEVSAILGMDFLSDVDAKIDLVLQQLVINEEKIVTVVVRVVSNFPSDV